MAERNYFSTGRRRGRALKRVVVGVLVVALIAGGAVAVYAFVNRASASDPPLPSAEADAFLTAWANGDTQAMAAAVDHPPADLATAATALTKATPGATAKYTRTSLLRTPTGADAGYHAQVNIEGFGHVAWNGTIPFVRDTTVKPAVWRIAWQPAILYPGLRAGEHLAFRRTWPQRAQITAGDGTVLAGNGSQVTIGIEPDRVAKSLPQIKTLFASLLGVDAATIDAAIHASGVQPNYFVPITTVPDDAHYANVLRPKLAPVDGVFFRRKQGVTTTGVAGTEAMVGSVGEITAERLKELGAPYRAGDQVGLSGVQKTFEERLAGRPSGDVYIAGRTPTRTIEHFAGTAPQPVRITIDPAIQRAADGALAGAPDPAALVAIDTRTGRIVAAASKPVGGFDRALDGTYPPGSTFKIITSAALLANGANASTPAPCPPQITIYGRTFKNFEGESGAALDLAQAFKISCNNAFSLLADKLPGGALQRAAEQFGFNRDWSLPVPAHEGSFPKPIDRADVAASAIGQGRVLASPAQMASVAAAIASGTWRAPALTSQPAATGPKPTALDPRVVATLRQFMASVVQAGGTAAGAGLPPGVSGKTGTAEFGSGNPPATHAWFVGYRGNLAFAVVVEGGGVGGRVAAPLAARFLNALG